jgi:hypothetical protein
MLYGEWFGVAPAKQAQVMARIVDHALGPRGLIPREWALEWAIPVIRRRRFADAPPLAEAVCRPICGELVAALVVASPRGSVLVDEAMLAGWEMSFDGLFAKALEALRAGRWLDIREAVEFRGGMGFSMNDYTASHILLPELFKPRWVHGQAVVMLPNVHTVAMVDSEDSGALRELAKMASPYREGEMPPLSFAPMILRDDRWELVDTEDPRFAVLARLTELDAQLTANPPPSEWESIPV